MKQSEIIVIGYTPYTICMASVQKGIYQSETVPPVFEYQFSIDRYCPDVFADFRSGILRNFRRNSDRNFILIQQFVCFFSEIVNQSIFLLFCKALTVCILEELLPREEPPLELLLFEELLFALPLLFLAPKPRSALRCLRLGRSSSSMKISMSSKCSLQSGSSHSRPSRERSDL